jgi:hypothetical protein
LSSGLTKLRGLRGCGHDDLGCGFSCGCDNSVAKGSGSGLQQQWYGKGSTNATNVTNDAKGNSFQFQFLIFHDNYNLKVHIDEYFKHVFGPFGPTGAQIWPLKGFDKNLFDEHFPFLIFHDNYSDHFNMQNMTTSQVQVLKVHIDECFNHVFRTFGPKTAELEPFKILDKKLEILSFHEHYKCDKYQEPIVCHFSDHFQHSFNSFGLSFQKPFVLPFVLPFVQPYVIILAKHDIKQDNNPGSGLGLGSCHNNLKAHIDKYLKHVFGPFGPKTAELEPFKISAKYIYFHGQAF